MRAFLILLAAYTLSQFYRAFLAIVAVDLNRDIGLSPADLGQVSAAWFAAFALGQFPVGWALDRFGPRRTVSVFMIAAVAGAAWLSAASSKAECLAAMSLIGLGCAPVLMGSLYLFGRIYPPERFAMLSSLVIGLGNAGNLLGATPLALAAEAFGWRAALAGMAGITAASALLVALALRDPERLEGGQGGTLLGGLREIAGMRALWLIVPVTLVSYAVVVATRSLWIAPFLSQVHGFDALARGNAAFAMAVAMSAGALAYGPIERLVGDPKRTALAGSAATGALFLALGSTGHTSGATAVALLAALGMTGMTYGIIMAHARRFFPARLLGRGVTAMNFVFMGGAGLVQILSGAFVARSQAAGLPPADTFATLHLAFGAALLAATALYLLAPAKPAAGRMAAQAAGE
ncbi:MFS transporter [Salinarimonas soli]|uniref:MFS transporter n=1 Tax=Salinarimonas soli TaxID=1638099 RepID=A0A5B2VB94_9HYPH|nr:MFS transporter [Salinarimonas soli]KAA2235720.1 MFS transporter [Salinarimonas soli]